MRPWGRRSAGTKPPLEEAKPPVVPEESAADSEDAGIQTALLHIQLALLTPENTVAYEQATSAANRLLSRARGDLTRCEALTVLGKAYQGRRTGGRNANLEQARTYLEDALELAERLDVPQAESPTVPRAEILHNLGVIYKQRLTGSRADNLERAIGYLHRALDASSPEEAPKNWATTASQLGNTYSSRLLGDHAQNIERALEWYAKALRYRPRDEVPVQWAITTHNIGTTLTDRVLGVRRNNLRDAQAYLERALEVRTEDRLPEHFALTQSTLADCLVRLASVEGDAALELLDAAITCCEAAARVWTLDRYRKEWLTNTLRLGELHRERTLISGSNDLERALLITDQVLLAASPTADALELRLAHEHRARVFHQRAEPADVERAISEMTAVMDALDPAGDAEAYVQAAAFIGRAHADLGQWRQAAEAFQNAAQAEGDLAAATETVVSQWARTRNARGLHDDAAYALCSAGRVDDAMVALERGRSRVLGETIDRNRADLESLDAFGSAGQQARAEFVSAAEIVAASTATEVSAGAIRGLAIDARLREDSRRAREQLLRASDNIRTFAGLEGFLAEPDIEAIARAARYQQPIVYLFANAHGSFALGVGHDQNDRKPILSIPLRLTTRDIDNMLLPNLQTGWPGLVMAASSSDTMPPQMLNAVLSYTGQAVSEPLRRLLTAMGARGATLVPSGRLSALPIPAALYAEEAPRCLLDDFAIRVAPSARVAAASRDAIDHRSGRVYLGVGDPAPGASSLLWAMGEVNHVARRAESSSVLAGNAAERHAVLEAMRSADVVHLACHGHFDPLSAEASSLLLADGPLSMAELMSSGRLQNARLVIASACESGISDVTALPDELTGLAATFLQVGAAQVLGTLWPVNDLSASMLVSHVASACLDPERDAAAELAEAQTWLRDLSRDEALVLARDLADAAGEDPAGQLADAIAWLELSENERPFAEPSHWAPFVLYGG